jgi:hypothetical protein
VLALQKSEKYKRRPKTSLFYKLTERYCADFIASLTEQGKSLTKYIDAHQLPL